MSTSAIIVVGDAEGDAIVNIYKHWDGNPAELLNNIKIRFKDLKFELPRGNKCKMYHHAKDMGDFAAQLVTFLKTEPGDVYLCSTDTGDEKWTEYTYIIVPKEDQLYVRIYAGYDMVSAGFLSSLVVETS